MTWQITLESLRFTYMGPSLEGSDRSGKLLRVMWPYGRKENRNVAFGVQRLNV